MIGNLLVLANQLMNLGRKPMESKLERRLYEVLHDTVLVVRQVPVGPYTLDFLAMGCVCVEMDGHFSHRTPAGREKDARRDHYLLMHKGWPTVRFTDKDLRNKQMIRKRVIQGIGWWLAVKLLRKYR